MERKPWNGISLGHLRAPGAGLIRVLDRIANLASYVAYVISGAVIAVMAVLTAFGIFSRQVLHHVYVDTVVLGKLSVAVLTFLGLAWAYHEGRHVAAEVVVARLPRNWALIVDAGGQAVGLVGVLVAMILTWNFAYSSLLLDAQILGIMRVPAFPFQAAMPFGLGLLSLQMLRQIVLDLLALKDPSREMPILREYGAGS